MHLTSLTVFWLALAMAPEVKAASTSVQDYCVYLSSPTSYVSYDPRTSGQSNAYPRRRSRRSPEQGEGDQNGTNTTNFRFDYQSEDERPVARNIIGGTTLPPNSWPFLAALLVTGDTLRYNGQYWDLVCGATLIHPQFILTAAHCFVDEGRFSWRYLDASNFAVRIGDYDLVKNSVSSARTVRITSYSTYPLFNYDTVELGFDIAIAKLEQPVPFNEWTQPACLPETYSPVPHASTPCLVAGWGSINRAGTRLSAYPRIATLPASTSRKCYTTLEIPGDAKDGRMFCAGDPGGRKDSCAGDSGGPTFCQKRDGAWELSGVVSFGGEHCADSEIPGAYTTVSYFMTWVATTLRSMGATNRAPPALQAPPSPYYTTPSRRRPWEPYLPGRPGYNNRQTTTKKSDAALLSLLEQLIGSMGGRLLSSTRRPRANVAGLP